MRRHLALLVVTLAVLAPLAGCGDDDGSNDSTATTAVAEDPLEGRTFEAVSIDDKEGRTLDPAAKLRISFADGEITVDTGCNELTASYQIQEVILVIQPIGGSEVPCPTPELTEQQGWFTELLTDRPVITPAPPDGLVLTYGAEEGARLHLEEVTDEDGVLVGPVWTADTIVGEDGAGSVPAGVTATITFADDGTYAVAAGCNTGSGTYRDPAGDTVVIDPPTLTRERCDEETTVVETAFVALLDGEVTAEIEPDRLTLTADGTGLSFAAG